MSRVDPETIKSHIAEVVPLSRARPTTMTEDEFNALPSSSAGSQTGATADELPEHLLDVPGLVGVISRWITKTSLYPQPTLALGAALGVISAAAGRKFAGPTKSGTHLYTLCLAPTGAGKNHPAKQAKRILRAADLKERLGPSIFMSDSAVYQHVSAQPEMLCVMDEFGSYLQKINAPKGGGYEKAISGILRTLWGASYDVVTPPAWAASSSREKMPPIQSPAVSIYAMSVHEEFYAALQSNDIANGFLNRFLILSTQQKPEEVEEPLSDDEIPEKYIIEPLRQISSSNYDPRRTKAHDLLEPAVRLDWACADARLTYRGFKKSIEQRAADAKLLSRTPEMALRLATLRAIGKGSLLTPRVHVDDIVWGCELALWSAERMIADAALYMIESEHQGQANEVLRKVKELGRASMTTLNRALKNKYPAPKLRMIIEGLIDAEYVEVVRVKHEGAGRPTDFIRYVGGI